MKDREVYTETKRKQIMFLLVFFMSTERGCVIPYQNTSNVRISLNLNCIFIYQGSRCTVVLEKPGTHSWL